MDKVKEIDFEDLAMVSGGGNGGHFEPDKPTTQEAELKVSMNHMFLIETD